MMCFLFYAKGDENVFNTQYVPHKAEYLKRFKPDKEGRLRRTDVNPTKGGTRTIYLDAVEGDIIDSVWTDIFPVNPVAIERLGYPTQKPETLLERIIEASSNEGDVVLDAFCGCGTTIAVAQRLKREWIGIDITYQSISLILRRLKRMFDAEFGKGDKKTKDILDHIELQGVPKDMDSVDALIHKKDDRVRKEFEKWAVLTYSDNRAAINEKKGGDGGIDGIAYTRKAKDDYIPVILSVKSGVESPKHIREIFGIVEDQDAACGILLTRYVPTRGMYTKAKSYGKFKPEGFPPYDRVQIVTVQEMLDGARMNLPLMEEVTKKAQTAKTVDQPSLLDE